MQVLFITLPSSANTFASSSSSTLMQQFDFTSRKATLNYTTSCYTAQPEEQRAAALIYSWHIPHISLCIMRCQNGSANRIKRPNRGP